MLTPAERKTLYDQLKFVLEQFVDSPDVAVTHAILRITVEALEAIRELDDSLTDVGDEASCGPPAPDATDPDGFQHRCDRCHQIL